MGYLTLPALFVMALALSVRWALDAIRVPLASDFTTTIVGFTELSEDGYHADISQTRRALARCRMAFQLYSRWNGYCRAG